MQAFANLPLRTARLLLRPLQQSDVPALFTIHSDHQVMRYWDAPIWKNDERGRTQDARDMALATQEYLRLGMALADSGQLIGSCSLWNIDAQHRRAELGYALGSAHWGHGYMQEAVSALLDYAFGELNLNRMEVDTDTRNEASLRLLERLGFKQEGLFRERCIVEGEISDSAMFGMLRRDWTSQPPSHLGQAIGKS